MSKITDMVKSNPFSSPFQSNANNRKIAFAAAAGPAKPGEFCYGLYFSKVYVLNT